MTKRYILPTWDEFSKDRMVLVGYTDDPFTVKVGDRPVRKDDYNAIREATAIEDGLSPLATDALVKFAKGILQKQNRETLASLKADDTVTIVMDAPQFVHLWYLAHGEESPLIEDSERLVGKARGEDRGVSFAAALRMMDAVFGPRPGPLWVDVGGGEEKPVNNVAQFSVTKEELLEGLKEQKPKPPAAPENCGNCKFYSLGKRAPCQRYPEGAHTFADDWCGEWRAKA